jgi:adenine-specific DNA-methyltransferase
MNAKILHGDCIEQMRTLPDNSVDLIATDPPYYRVKGEAWDRQWETPAAFLSWVDELCREWQRILKPNGSLYVFASPRMAARVEVTIAESFNVINRIRWVKEAGWHNKTEKEALRGYLSPWEEVIFAEHYGVDNMAKGEAGYEAKCDELRGFIFESLRSYLDGERRRAGFNYRMCNEAIGKPVKGGGMATHYFSAPDAVNHFQWALPTREHYESLRRLFNANGGDFLRREYDDLRREYDDLRRPFAVTADVPYTDVWNFPTVAYYPGKHPCEKPIAMMEHIIRTSSRPGAVVLDCFMGSGSTLVAAQNLGRDAIGIELNESYIEQARRRLGQTMLPLELAGQEVAA